MKNFTTKTTGMPWYDDMLSKPDYFFIEKGIETKIVRMSPLNYLKESAKIKGISYQEEIRFARGTGYVEEYIDKMRKGAVFPLPVLDYKDKTQEGRHRAIAADALGLKTIPVLIVSKGDAEKVKQALEADRRKKFPFLYKSS